SLMLLYLVVNTYPCTAPFRGVLMNRKGVLAILAALFLFTTLIVVAQQEKKQLSPKELAKQQSDLAKQQAKEESAKAKAKSKQAELSNQAMKKWLDEDAAYIITDDEKAT